MSTTTTTTATTTTTTTIATTTNSNHDLQKKSTLIWALISTAVQVQTKTRFFLFKKKQTLKKNLTRIYIFSMSVTLCITRDETKSRFPAMCVCFCKNALSVTMLFYFFTFAELDLFKN